MMWAACCTALFGFLCCSEFMVPTQQEFDPEVHLTVRDIDDTVTPSVVCITIKQSKTNPFRQGINLFLGITEHAGVLCEEYITISYTEK